MTSRFLMRPVFHTFLKFRKFRKNFRDTELYGWSRQILKKSKKTKDTASRAVNASYWTQYDLQLNYSIGGNFNIHLPTFSMDGRFPFYYAPGSLPTLVGPISDQVGPSRILSN